MNRNPSTKPRLSLANDSPMVAAVEAGHTTFAPKNENEVTSTGSTKNRYGNLSSSDGTKLTAAAALGSIWASANSGANWTEVTSTGGTKGWQDITSSSDGTKFAAVVTSGNIWTSTDSGETWTEVKPTESIQEYPSGPLTNYETHIEGHGLFKAYASTDYGETPYRSWNAFDKTIFNYNGWASASGTWLTDGTTTPVSSVADNFDGVECHWLALQLPYEVKPTLVTLRARNDPHVPTEVPAKGRIYGSKDGATWDQIKSYDIRTEVGTLQASTDNAPISITLTTNEYYTHLLLTVDERYGGAFNPPSWTAAGELRYFGTARRPQNWRYITSSSDGTKLAATASGGNIWTSTDSGETWTSRASTQNWYGITSSSDGTKLAATVYNGNIWTSIDSGETWTSRASTQVWRSITSSSDGTKLAATASGGNIWTSTDSGETWTSRASTQSWYGITSSSDGTKLAATVSGGNIWTSTDSGETWTSWATTQNWYGITSSSDGTKLAATVYNGNIWTYSAPPPPPPPPPLSCCEEALAKYGFETGRELRLSP